MTTNYIDRLDPALIRPGRVDVKREISHVTSAQLSTMFSRFYPEAPAEMAAEFAAAATETQTNLSAAQVQALFMFYKEHPEHSVKMAHIIHQL